MFRSEQRFQLGQVLVGPDWIQTEPALKSATLPVSAEMQKDIPAI